MLRKRLSGPVCLLATLLAACEGSQHCPGAPCPPDLTVFVRRASGPFAPGTYRLILTEVGFSDTCDVSIAQSGAGSSSCAADFDPESNAESFSVRPSALPEELRLAFIAGDSLLIDTTLSPTYEHVYPYGRECGPCPRGVAEIVIP